MIERRRNSRAVWTDNDPEYFGLEPGTLIYDLFKVNPDAWRQRAEEVRKREIRKTVMDRDSRRF